MFIAVMDTVRQRANDPSDPAVYTGQVRAWPI